VTAFRELCSFELDRKNPIRTKGVAQCSEIIPLTEKPLASYNATSAFGIQAPTNAAPRRPGTYSMGHFTMK